MERCEDILPTKTNLLKRTFLWKDVKYQLSQFMEVKRRQYAMLYGVVQRFLLCWAEPTSPIQKWWCIEIPFFYLWKYIINKLSIKDVEEVTIIFRQIWLRRNHFVLNYEFKSQSRVIKEATTEGEEYKQAQDSITTCKKNISRVSRDNGRSREEGILKLIEMQPSVLN